MTTSTLQSLPSKHLSQVLAMLTAEKQRVVIDWYVRWRISDPQEYIRNVGLDESAGANQLNRVVRNAFQEEVNKRTVKELLSLKREDLMRHEAAAPAIALPMLWHVSWRNEDTPS